MILLVSVSARMLAELATREGHDVFAVDRFGDLDLQRLCPSVSIMRDLGGRGGMAELVDAAERIRAESVVYGAGLENRPDLVARLAAGRTLLGCTPQTLRRVRDPAVLGASLRAAGLAYPTHALRPGGAGAGGSRTPLAAQADPRRRRPRGARVARRPAGRRRHRAGAHLRAPVLGGGGRRRTLRGSAGRERAADRAPRARRPRLDVVRERRAAAAAGARAGRADRRRPGDLRAPGRRLRPARRVRRGPRLGRRAGVGGGGQPAPGRVARDDRRRARRPLVRGAPGGVRRTPAGCRLGRPRRSRPGRPARRCSSRPRTCGFRTRASGRPAGSATCPTPASRSPPAVRSARSSRRDAPRRPCSPIWRRAPPRCAASSTKWASMPSHDRSATCGGCGLVCDDITAVVGDDGGLERLIAHVPAR